MRLAWLYVRAPGVRMEMLPHRPCLKTTRSISWAMKDKHAQRVEDGSWFGCYEEMDFLTCAVAEG